ncbi:uncharacterized protein LOC142342869 isoform X2 [Convolutriloba macropyga]|uniref:uncharacterized protein LOC142342869 isoform X2 n=1 Tax=Convolutriloba macropyga TaxID=536237 RepID=UPI003F528BA5
MNSAQYELNNHRLPNNSSFSPTNNHMSNGTAAISGTPQNNEDSDSDIEVLKEVRPPPKPPARKPVPIASKPTSPLDAANRAQLNQVAQRVAPGGSGGAGGSYAFYANNGQPTIHILNGNYENSQPATQVNIQMTPIIVNQQQHSPSTNMHMVSAPPQRSQNQMARGPNQNRMPPPPPPQSASQYYTTSSGHHSQMQQGTTSSHNVQFHQSRRHAFPSNETYQCNQQPKTNNRVGSNLGAPSQILQTPSSNKAMTIAQQQQHSRSLQNGSGGAASSSGGADQNPLWKGVHQLGKQRYTKDDVIRIVKEKGMNCFYAVRKDFSSAINQSHRSSVNSFKCHFLTSHDRRTCSENFPVNMLYMNHIDSHFWKSETLQSDIHTTTCKSCFMRFPNQETLKTHMDFFHSSALDGSGVQFACHLCDYTFSKSEIYMRHMFELHEICETPYHCRICQFSTSFYSQLVSHFRSEHQNTKWFLCRFCFGVYSTAEQFCEHMRDHLPRKNNVKCTKCRLIFVKQASISQTGILPGDNWTQNEHQRLHHSGLAKLTQDDVFMVTSFGTAPNLVMNPQNQIHSAPLGSSSQFQVRPNSGLDTAMMRPIGRAPFNQFVARQRSNFPPRLSVNQAPGQVNVRRMPVISGTSGANEPSMYRQEPPAFRGQTPTIPRPPVFSGTQNLPAPHFDPLRGRFVIDTEAPSIPNYRAKGTHRVPNPRNMAMTIMQQHANRPRHPVRMPRMGVPSVPPPPMQPPPSQPVTQNKAPSSGKSTPDVMVSVKAGWTVFLKFDGGFAKVRGKMKLWRAGLLDRCIECGSYLNEPNRHFTRLMDCKMCPYSTYCPRAAINHFGMKHGVPKWDTKAIKEPDGMFTDMDCKLDDGEMMKCFCGFESESGTKFASHVYFCRFGECDLPQKDKPLSLPDGGTMKHSNEKFMIQSIPAPAIAISSLGKSYTERHAKRTRKPTAKTATMLQDSNSNVHVPKIAHDVESNTYSAPRNTNAAYDQHHSQLNSSWQQFGGQHAPNSLGFETITTSEFTRLVQNQTQATSAMNGNLIGNESEFQIQSEPFFEENLPVPIGDLDPSEFATVVPAAVPMNFNVLTGQEEAMKFDMSVFKVPAAETQDGARGKDMQNDEKAGSQDEDIEVVHEVSPLFDAVSVLPTELRTAVFDTLNTDRPKKDKEKPQEKESNVKETGASNQLEKTEKTIESLDKSEDSKLVSEKLDPNAKESSLLNQSEDIDKEPEDSNLGTGKTDSSSSKSDSLKRKSEHAESKVADSGNMPQVPEKLENALSNSKSTETKVIDMKPENSEKSQIEVKNSENTVTDLDDSAKQEEKSAASGILSLIAEAQVNAENETRSLPPPPRPVCGGFLSSFLSGPGKPKISSSGVPPKKKAKTLDATISNLLQKKNASNSEL